jgi:hypothetical protein
MLNIQELLIQSMKKELFSGKDELNLAARQILAEMKTKFVDIRIHLTFKGVSVFTDAYYSPLEKLLSRFENVYVCESNSINEKGEFVIDDCILIKCSEVDVIELPH